MGGRGKGISSSTLCRLAPVPGASSIAQQAALTALALGPRGGEAVQLMVDSFRERRDYLVARLRAVEGVQLDVPAGAFYVLPRVKAFFGRGAEAAGFGAVPDVDTLCR
jgi:bifunctional aspartate aminotransferase and glutamate/aspartate-prephenate aminotransferase